MLKVEILGTGCARCVKLHAETVKAIAASGVDADLVKVEEIDQIMACGVAFTPALVIDGAVKSSGKIPTVAQISTWLTAAVVERSTAG